MTRPVTGPIGLFRRFHGRNPSVKGRAFFHAPKKFIELGQAVAIVYKTDKLNGGGDGKMCEYVHEFETPCVLLADETFKGQLYIMGNSLKITKNGIEN